MTESESVALPLGESPICCFLRAFLRPFSCVILSNFFLFGKHFAMFLLTFFKFRQKNKNPSFFRLFAFVTIPTQRLFRWFIMFLSDYIGKTILVNKQPRGVCLGIGFSLKNQAVKCLLCAPSAQKNPVFAVSISAVSEVEDCITLSRLRTVLPNNCARIAIGAPVYSYDGDFLGELTDAELKNGQLFRLCTNRRQSFPANTIFACNDAVILRKEQPYPLGQRVPAPMLLQICDKTDGFVTRPLLRTAIAHGALIKLTLSLPPFSKIL